MVLEFTLREGELREVTLAPGEPIAPLEPSAPAASAAPPPPPVPAPSASGPPAPQIAPARPAGQPPAVSGRASATRVLAGAGGLSLALGVGARAWALQRTGVRSDHGSGNACDSRGLEAAGEQRALGNVSTISIGVGPVCLGVATCLMLAGSDPSLGRAHALVTFCACVGVSRGAAREVTA
jgi:hypothetical protein